MNLKRLIRSMCLAAVFAALCTFGGAVGAIVPLVAGLVGLAKVSRRTPDASGFSEYPWWLFCTGAFAAASLLLLPLAFPAVCIALCILSPLFGTMTYVVERSLISPAALEDLPPSH